MRVRVLAPGRVNLMGGHTDYTGGLVLPMAIDLGTTLVGTRGGREVRIESAEEAGTAVVPLDIVDPASVSPPWARYVAGVVAELRPSNGFTGEVSTTIPVGTGLSSSAALEVAVALALGHEYESLPELAEVLRRAEFRGSGMPCGIMDQLSSLAGVEGHALLIDCTALTVTPVALPDDIAIVVVDSGERRQLATSGYADRRAEVAAVDELIGPLPQATLADVDGVEDPVLRKRARHVVTENARVREFCAALAADDRKTAGEIMLASHASLRDDQEVTTPALDALVDRLRATPGVHGARLTGGGWGGSVVALTDPGALTEGVTVRASAGARVEFVR